MGNPSNTLVLRKSVSLISTSNNIQFPLYFRYLFRMILGHWCINSILWTQISQWVLVWIHMVSGSCVQISRVLQVIAIWMLNHHPILYFYRSGLIENHVAYFLSQRETIVKLDSHLWRRKRLRCHVITKVKDPSLALMCLRSFCMLNNLNRSTLCRPSELDLLLLLPMKMISYFTNLLLIVDIHHLLLRFCNLVFLFLL